MSITYSGDLHKISPLTFLKIIFKWRGSIYKSIWKEAVFLSILSLIFSILLRFIILPDKTPLIYNLSKTIITSAKATYSRIPIAFVLGFYVSLVLVRWYAQMELVPWPDETALVVAACIQGKDDQAIIIRRQIMRYMTVCFVLAASFHFENIRNLISGKKDFLKSGLLDEEDWERLYKTDLYWSKYFIPSNWAINLVLQARDLKYIKDDVIFDYCISKLSDYRSKVSNFFIIDYINPPLVYTQVAGLVVYVYIYGAVLAYQNMDINNRSGIFLYAPPFELFLYLFYLAWYKIAEDLMNPFGNTDFTFDIIYMVQRSLQVSFLFVDQLHTNHPQMFPVEDVHDKLSGEFSNSLTIHKTLKKSMSSSSSFEVKSSGSTKSSIEITKN